MREPLRRTVSLGAGALSCLEWESSGPPLHFAHANGFNAGTYRRLLAPLAEGFHVFACDQRGHGFSTLPATPGLASGWTIFRDDLVALLDRLDTGPVILAGHSMGATASLLAAAAAPDRVRALVLFEPVLVAPSPHAGSNPGPDLASRALKRRRDFSSFEEALVAFRGRGIFKSWAEGMLEDYLRGGLVSAPDGTVTLACAPEWEAACFRETPLHVARIATQVRCPIAIVHGEIASTSLAGEIATVVSARPATRVVSIEGTSHFLPMERPDIVREEILRMLNHLRSTGVSA